MEDQKPQDNQPKTTQEDGQKYVDGVCVNCGDKLALPKELQQKIKPSPPAA